MHGSCPTNRGHVDGHARQGANNAYNVGMGVQRQDLTSEQVRVRPEKSGAIWNKLPRLLNLSRYETQVERRSETLDYEPIHLHITPGEVHPMAAMQGKASFDRKLDLETFRFVLEQVPAVRTIEFSGRAEPFRNEHLLNCVDYAFKFNGAESTVYTDGFLLPQHIDAILQSSLHCLVVRIHAHRPSAYAQMTGKNPNNFVTLRDNVAQLMRRKREIGGHVEVDLVMTVDRHNFTEMADMIRFAEEMGVDGLRFENYANPNMPGMRSDRSLYTSQRPVLKYFEDLKRHVFPRSKLVITLPTLLDDDMSSHRNCLDPFTTVSIDADFNVSGCSRQLLYHGKMAKIWDETFWNDGLYKWLRAIHGSRRNGCGESGNVPLPCQNCPRNMPR